MMKKVLLPAALLVAFGLAGCATDRAQSPVQTPATPPAPQQPATKDGVGAEIGDGTGRTVTSIAGNMAGAYIGGDIASHLTAEDRDTILKTTQRTLETVAAGKTVKWATASSGNSGTITPQPAYSDPEGQTCREYQETITAKGDTQTGFRTACRKPDGTWRVVGN